jgi:hypothetical protein
MSKVILLRDRGHPSHTGAPSSRVGPCFGSIPGPRSPGKARQTAISRAPPPPPKPAGARASPRGRSPARGCRDCTPYPGRCWSALGWSSSDRTLDREVASDDRVAEELQQPDPHALLWQRTRSRSVGPSRTFSRWIGVLLHPPDRSSELLGHVSTTMSTVIQAWTLLTKFKVPYSRVVHSLAE